MPLKFTEVLPLPAGGFGARCTCGWFEVGPVEKPDNIDKVVAEHAATHSDENGGQVVTHSAG